MRMSAEERRESILRAAVPEFARGGLHGTSTESIASRADVSQPYIFRLFGNKRDLFIATVRHAFAVVEDTFRRAAADQNGEDAGRAMGQAYRELLIDRDLLLLQLHAYAACDDAEVRDATRAEFGRLWRTVAELTGAPAEEIREFFATGMLMNVAAAMDLVAASADPAAGSWVSACLAAPQPTA